MRQTACGRWRLFRTARRRRLAEPGKDFKVIDAEGKTVGESDTMEKALRSAEHANERIRENSDG